MDGVVELLAYDHSGTNHVDTDIVWSMDHAMISSIFSVILSLFAVNETIEVGQKVYSALKTADKIIEKTEKQEWKASLHEEAYQILKDITKEKENDEK